jgi:hypothetical protein
MGLLALHSGFMESSKYTAFGSFGSQFAELPWAIYFYLLFTAFGRAPPARVPPHRTGAAELGGRASARGLLGSRRSPPPRPALPLPSSLRR